MSITALITATGTAVLASSVLLAPPAAAGETSGGTSQGSTVAPDTVIATSPTQSTTPTIGTRVQVVGIDYLPAGLSISGHAAKTVTLTTGGRSARTIRPSSAATPARFTRLVPGRAYAVSIGGIRVGSARVITRPGSTHSLSVRTTADPGAVLLTWAYTPAAHTGPISFRATATPVPGQPVTAAVSSTAAGSAREIVLGGLDPHSLYRFTVAAINPTGSGRSASAAINRTLGDLTGADAAAQEAATKAAAEAAAKAEADRKAAEAAAASKAVSPPASGSGGTRTVHVCPDGYTDAGADCVKTRAYTFHPETITQAYTYHTEPTGPAPIVDTYTTTGTCPGDYNREDYGWVVYCRKYGAVPTKQVKDPTPDGYVDTGTAWTKTVDVKDPTPTGYTDTGTAWTMRVAKVARTVPA